MMEDINRFGGGGGVWCVCVCVCVLQQQTETLLEWCGSLLSTSVRSPVEMQHPFRSVCLRPSIRLGIETMLVDSSGMAWQHL